MALQSVDEVMRDIQDEVPPLVVLQAVTLCAFNELMRGVRGKGWRLLGSCVRIAYEQRLHLTDFEAPSLAPKCARDTERWVGKEERRRCWWAIWEMDVFASTVRRSPLAIDWAMNETYLPVDDESWFKNTYAQSCFLDLRPCERWKKLKRSGNKSPAAWFIVLTSIMREAQALTRGNLQGVRSEWGDEDRVTGLQEYFRNVFRKKTPAGVDQQLCFLSHALQRTISALPETLAYRGEQLNFGSDGVDPVAPSSFGRNPGRFLDASRYSIFLMTQLARFQIFHHYAFSEIASGALFAESSAEAPFGWTAAQPPSPGKVPNCEGLRNCLEAADDIYAILKNVPEAHVKWVNPFLASTVWLAASLQILRKVYGIRAEDVDESKFSLLRFTCQRYSVFWGTPLALLDNVDSLEKHLMQKRETMAEMEARCKARQQRANRSRRDKSSAANHRPGNRESSGAEGAGNGDAASDQLESIGAISMMDLHSMQTLLSDAQSLDLSTRFFATPFLNMMTGWQTDLDDISIGYSPDPLDPSFYPALDGQNGLGETDQRFN